jgi:hypothetical protein
LADFLNAEIIRRFAGKLTIWLRCWALQVNKLKSGYFQKADITRGRGEFM